jgi:hypothetical protein
MHKRTKNINIQNHYKITTYNKLGNIPYYLLLYFLQNNRSMYCLTWNMIIFPEGSQSIYKNADDTDATDLQHTTTLYILWLSIKIDVFIALKFILSKMVNPSLTMSPWIQ